MSRVDFYCLTGDEFFFAMVSAIRLHAETARLRRLTADHETLLVWGLLIQDVANGGLTQYFYNRGGARGVEQVANRLDLLRVSQVGLLLRAAVKIYRGHRSRFKVNNPFNGLFGSIDEFKPIDRALARAMPRATSAMEQWSRTKVGNLLVDEDGHPIAPKFSGTIETRQSNGLVGEYLEVRNGKPHGAYREFFDDGTVRKVIFYHSGKSSGDFWPTGVLKKRETRKGERKLIEWFYPSGKVQKRFVANKDGHATEPIRRFHENGQLAEELSMLRRRKQGPWRKIFDDGSPQLQATHDAKRGLIVHNAWDDERRQVVKKGSGLFHDDAREINPSYAVFSAADWPSDIELKNGIPHGRCTTYHRGVIIHTWTYKKGVRHGKQTEFWDNGRVKSVAMFRDGKPTKEVATFPKFDLPVPAVRLRIEANEELYSAWEHMAVDEYPAPLNLDALQETLVVPSFLDAMHERNRSGTLQSDEEDWNMFEDGIAYLLTVSATGDVTKLAVNGSGFHAAHLWDTYKPILWKLRFAPGRIRGRAVECRVVAWVDHKFVEGVEH